MKMTETAKSPLGPGPWALTGWLAGWLLDEICMIGYGPERVPNAASRPPSTSTRSSRKSQKALVRCGLWNVLLVQYARFIYLSTEKGARLTAGQYAIIILTIAAFCRQVEQTRLAPRLLISKWKTFFSKKKTINWSARE
jgi:hypothetical protein